MSLHSTVQHVNPVTVSYDRIRPLSKNLGHCLETHTGSHLEVEETVSPDNTTVISHLTTANFSIAFHDSTRPPSKNLGHCLENDTGSQLEDADTAMVRNSNTQNPPVLIRSCRKVHTFRERMNRLLQLKNQYPTDIFNMFVARLRSANPHLFVERPSEDHD